jgi:hypothetical protein
MAESVGERRPKEAALGNGGVVTKVGLKEF